MASVSRREAPHWASLAFLTCMPGFCVTDPAARGTMAQEGLQGLGLGFFLCKAPHKQC